MWLQVVIETVSASQCQVELFSGVAAMERREGLKIANERYVASKRRGTDLC